MTDHLGAADTASKGNDGPAFRVQEDDGRTVLVLGFGPHADDARIRFAASERACPVGPVFVSFRRPQ